ncbi:MAG: pilus assembly protein FimV, partial [bacterium]|nr:pilus assembly protein FimV [bacterium]
SALDQPFLAEIELIDADSAPLNNMKVGLADPENFEEIGVARSDSLSFLNFQITKNAHGKLIVLVQSKERMVEPYLELVIDLTWSQGQLYKAYTVLLDPPGYKLTSSTIQGSPTHYKKIVNVNLNNEPGVIDKTIFSTVEPNPVEIKDGKKKSVYGPTVMNENVWQIAQRYKTSSVILPQVVLAIVGANPDAFNEGNLNGLKVGVNLNIPSTQDISHVASDLATAEVMAHDKAWNEKTSINHVISPPYMGSKIMSPDQGSQMSGGTNNDSKLVSIPQLNMQTPVTLNSSSQFENPVSTVNSSNNQPVVQNQANDTAMKAELSITVSAIETVRESNALLTEQLHIMQDQNKKLQQQLEKRDHEMEVIRKQMQMMMKQRYAVSSQANSSDDHNGTSYFWPLIILLLAAGGGASYWYFKKREEEIEETSPYIINTPVKPSSMTAIIREISPGESATHLKSQDINQLEKLDGINQEDRKDTNNKEDSDNIDSYKKEHIDSADKKLVEPTVIPLTKKMEIQRLNDTSDKNVLPVVASETSPTTVTNVKEVKADSNQPETMVSENTKKPAFKQQESRTTISEEYIDKPKHEDRTEKSEPDAILDPKSSKSSKSLNADFVGDHFFKDNTLEFESGLHNVLASKTAAQEKAEDEEKDFSNQIIFVPVLSEVEMPKVHSINKDNKAEEIVTEAEVEYDNNAQKNDKTNDIENASESEQTANSSVFEKEFDVTNNSDEQLDVSSNPLKSIKALDTLLALAKTYLGMDDVESARDSLNEVLEHGNAEQKEKAQFLLNEIKDK